MLNIFFSNKHNTENKSLICLIHMGITEMDIEKNKLQFRIAVFCYSTVYGQR